LSGNLEERSLTASTEDSRVLNDTALYEQFKREKQYLDNVSKATINGYGWAGKVLEKSFASSAAVAKAAIVSRVAERRAAGMAPVTIHTYCDLQRLPRLLGRVSAALCNRPAPARP